MLISGLRLVHSPIRRSSSSSNINGVGPKFTSRLIDMFNLRSTCALSTIPIAIDNNNSNSISSINSSSNLSHSSGHSSTENSSNILGSFMPAESSFNTKTRRTSIEMKVNTRKRKDRDAGDTSYHRKDLLSKFVPYSFDRGFELTSGPNEGLFTPYEVGRKWFYRNTLVNEVCDDLIQSRNNATIYCKAPYGYGKSALLSLIGRELTSRGYVVYRMHAIEVEERENDLLYVLQEQTKLNKKCVLLLDDAHKPHYKRSIWVTLFKAPIAHGINNLVVLGVGVSTLVKDWYSESKPISYLIMRSGSKDMDEIIDFWVNFASNDRESLLLEPLVVTRDLVAAICNWVCEHTNGNMYLIVSFCRIYFSRSDLSADNASNYVDYFTSKAFFQAMEEFRTRCRLSDNVLASNSYFGYLNDRDRINFQSSLDVLSSFGHVDEYSGRMFSDYVLSCFQNQSKMSIVKNRARLPTTYTLAERCIIVGLRHMRESHFTADELGPPRYIPQSPSLEESICQLWSMHLIAEFENVFVTMYNNTLSTYNNNNNSRDTNNTSTYRTRYNKIHGSNADFLIKIGKEKIAIEIALDGNQKDCVAMLTKFFPSSSSSSSSSSTSSSAAVAVAVAVDTDYDGGGDGDTHVSVNKEPFAILNIVTKTKDRIIRFDTVGIPEDRLKYLFEFNVQTNTLYRGDMVEPLLESVSSPIRDKDMKYMMY